MTSCHGNWFTRPSPPLIILLFLIVGCRSPAPVDTPHQPIAKPSLIIEAYAESYPTNCNPQEIANLVTQFFDAYNANDSARLIKFFDPSLHIAGLDGWFSDTLQDTVNLHQKPHFVSADRNEILSYIANRHLQKEQLDLTFIRISTGGWHGGIDIQYRLMRQAQDLSLGQNQTERLGIGKGTIKCPDKKIAVWSMTSEIRTQ